MASFNRLAVGCCPCCPLGDGDLQLALTFCEANWATSPPSGIHLVTETIDLFREEGTDTMLALAGITNAPHADGGVVWRSAPHVWRDGYDGDVGGAHNTCDPYFPLGIDNNTYLNFIFEVFCRGGAVVVVVNRFIVRSSTFCVPPSLMEGIDYPDGLSEPDISARGWRAWGTTGRVEINGLGVGVWNPTATPFWVPTGTPTDDPLYRDYLRNSLTACSLFKEMVLAEPPPP